MFKKNLGVSTRPRSAESIPSRGIFVRNKETKMTHGVDQLLGNLESKLAHWQEIYQRPYDGSDIPIESVRLALWRHGLKHLDPTQRQSQPAPPPKDFLPPDTK